MNSQQNYQQYTNAPLVQHSKRLANWSLIQWILVIPCVILTMVFANLTYDETNVLSSIITWSATQAGVGITGYMGNSSIEKYAAKKFSLSASVQNPPIQTSNEEVQG